MRSRGLLVVAVTVAVTALAAPSALGTARLPVPGTAAQVASLVASSAKIQQLPRDLLPSLSEVRRDGPGAYFAGVTHECDGPPRCVLGATKSSSTAVLFGDSHAYMWLPAIAPLAKRAGLRLVLLWKPGCPDTTISVWDANAHATSASCDSYRAAMLKLIHRLSPRLVLLSNRTTNVPGHASVLTTDEAWRAGLEATIASVKSATTKVAVIGDITAFAVILPDCLAAYPTKVQRCSVQNPNPKARQHVAAERAAAAAEGVAYVNPQGWLCTKVCSPVIGRMAAYYDAGHVSATYAAYLAGVFGKTLRPLLAP